MKEINLKKAMQAYAETRAQSKGCTVNLTEEAKAAILANFQSLSI